MSTFLIVEDDALHRNFLREVITLSDLECTNLLEADDGEAAIRMVAEHDPKGVIMDLQMPRKTGVQAAKAIWADNPTMPIVFWSNYADEAYVRGITKIVPANATYGYLLKTSSKERLRRSIQCVFLEGQNIIDREVRGVQQRGHSRSESLSEAEYEVLLDIAIGLTDQAIADRRRISLRSVQGRLQQLYAKLGLMELPTLPSGTAEYNSRTRAIALALTARVINGKSIEMAELDYRRASEA
ncbi:response regulator transcription factor [Devosia sp.]|uniref:response regulator transcription factor n=1 Tax=Devosia sp. TaxID=1871048 RepID=UPI0032667620